ncbi:uncharacterized protein [Pseudorasbora parva]|uniref:uncharacterized protein n=1 Tax=Pseudorasbora parva TaxID=51549 RepID=UPI00351F00F3
MASSKKAHFWCERETMLMLRILNEMDIMKCFDGRKNRNGDIFKRVAERMGEENYVRSAEQVRTRWKILKSSYYRAKTQNNTSGSNPSSFPYLETMHDILGHRPLSNVSENGVDIGFDGDMNEAEHSNAVDESSTGNDATSPVLPEEMYEERDEDASSADTSVNVSGEESFSATAPDVDPPRTKGNTRRKSARCTVISQHQQFMVQMMRQQNEWVQDQIQQSEQREERLLSALIESNARSTERIMSVLVEGFRSTQPMFAPPSLHPPHFQGYHAQPSNFHMHGSTVSNTSTPEHGSEEANNYARSYSHL